MFFPPASGRRELFGGDTRGTRGPPPTLHVYVGSSREPGGEPEHYGFASVGALADVSPRQWSRWEVLGLELRCWVDSVEESAGRLRLCACGCGAGEPDGAPRDTSLDCRTVAANETMTVARCGEQEFAVSVYPEGVFLVPEP